MKERQSAWWIFFRYPITVKKYIMAARLQAVARLRRPFLLLCELILFGCLFICPINDNFFLDLNNVSTYS